MGRPQRSLSRGTGQGGNLPQKNSDESTIPLNLNTKSGRPNSYPKVTQGITTLVVPSGMFWTLPQVHEAVAILTLFSVVVLFYAPTNHHILEWWKIILTPHVKHSHNKNKKKK